MKKIFLSMVLSLLLASPALAAEKTIVVATDATWPPMEFVDKNQNVVGFSVDYMNAAAELGGYKVVIKNVAWDAIFAGLGSNQYDAVCSSVTITEERKANMDFSTPYFTVRQAVITPKDATFKTMDDLKGKTAGSQISTTGTFAIQKAGNITSRPYDEVGLAVEDLYNGRIDAVVCDDAVAADFVLAQERYKDKLKIAFVLSTPEAEEFYGVAVNKGNKEVLDLINKGVAAVKASGKEDELLKKWIGHN